MFAGENRDNWDDIDLLPAVSVHESTGYCPYRLMFGMYIAGFPRQDPDLPDRIRGGL